MCQSCQGIMGKMPSLFSFLFFFPGKKKKKNPLHFTPPKGVWKIESILSGNHSFFFFHQNLSIICQQRVRPQPPKPHHYYAQQRWARTHDPGSTIVSNLSTFFPWIVEEPCMAMNRTIYMFQNSPACPFRQNHE